MHSNLSYDILYVFLLLIGHLGSFGASVNEHPCAYILVPPPISLGTCGWLISIVSRLHSSGMGCVMSPGCLRAAAAAAAELRSSFSHLLASILAAHYRRGF